MIEECPFCWDEIDTQDNLNHGFPYMGQHITECVGCHRKFEVFPDFSWEDGRWRDCSTMRPLKALT